MPVPTMMDFEAAVFRIQDLEDSVAQLQRLMLEQKSALQQLPLPIGAALDSVTGIPPIVPGRDGKFARLARPSAAEREHEDMAMILEDFAMNNRANRDRAVQSMGAAVTATSSDDDGEQAAEPGPARSQVGTSDTHLDGDIAVDAPQHTSTLPPLHTPDGHHAKLATASSALEAAHPLYGFALSRDDHVTRFLSQGPDPPRAWQLIQFYLAHLEWYSRVLHTPTFLEECKFFLASPKDVAVRTRPSFLATYFIVLCIALQYIGEQEKTELSYSTEQTRHMCLEMFSAAQAMLHLSEYLAVHSLENLQVIV